MYVHWSFDGIFPKAKTLLSSSRSITDKDRKFTLFTLMRFVVIYVYWTYRKKIFVLNSSWIMLTFQITFLLRRNRNGWTGRGGATFFSNIDMIQALKMESETFCWFDLLLSIFSIWTIHSLNYILWHCFQLSLGLSQKKHDTFWEILRVSCLYFYKFAGHLVVYHLTKTRSEKRLIQVMSSSQQQAWRCPRLLQMVKNGQLPSTLVFKVAWLQAPVRVIHLQGNLRRKFRKIVLRWNGKIRKEKMFQYRLNTFFLYNCNKLRGLLWFPTRCQ